MSIAETSRQGRRTVTLGRKRVRDGDDRSASIESSGSAAYMAVAQTRLRFPALRRPLPTQGRQREAPPCLVANGSFLSTPDRVLLFTATAGAVAAGSHPTAKAIRRALAFVNTTVLGGNACDAPKAADFVVAAVAKRLPDNQSTSPAPLFIVGLCVAAQIDAARLLGAGDLSVRATAECRGAFCGVRVVWVAPQWQRRGVASRLVDCARRHLAYGFEFSPEQCAFSAPTSDGQSFATRYSGSQSFLVFGDS